MTGTLWDARFPGKGVLGGERTDVWELVGDIGGMCSKGTARAAVLGLQEQEVF